MSASKSIQVPALQFVMASDLALHEKHDPSRTAPLAERIRQEGVLRNPPIVAPINGDGRFVVLDGANRTTGLRELGSRHMVVQVVDYEDPELVLDTWYHLVGEIQPREFAAAVGGIEGIVFEKTALLHARAELARRSGLAYVVYPDGSVFVARVQDDLHVRARLLNELVDAYRYQGRIYRVNTDQLDRVKSYYENIAALVVFPRYAPSEIIELARNGAKLPAGITRHVIPRRALRINIPLAMIMEDKPLAAKNAWLQDWLKKKLAGKEIRYYQESTWLFDE